MGTEEPERREREGGEGDGLNREKKERKREMGRWIDRGLRERERQRVRNKKERGIA